MNDMKKRRTAKILGYICVSVGALNLTITVVVAIREQMLAGSSLLLTGIGALTTGIILLVLASRKLPSGD